MKPLTTEHFDKIKKSFRKSTIIVETMVNRCTSNVFGKAESFESASFHMEPALEGLKDIIYTFWNKLENTSAFIDEIDKNIIAASNSKFISSVERRVKTLIDENIAKSKMINARFREIANTWEKSDKLNEWLEIVNKLDDYSQIIIEKVNPVIGREFATHRIGVPLQEQYQATGNQEIKIQEKIKTKGKEKVTVAMAALICFYNGTIIPKDKNFSNPIAQEFGFNSGDALYNKYSYYAKQNNRIRAEDNDKKNENKTKLFDAVISHLSGNAKIRAEEERITFLSRINNGEE